MIPKKLRGRPYYLPGVTFGMQLTKLPMADCVLAVGITLTLCQCVTTTESSIKKVDKKESKSEPTHYVLEKLPVKKQAHPSPDYYPFSIRWYNGEKLLEQYLGFRGWDFNHDGRVDFVEALDNRGLVIGQSFDFDFDGKIDKSL